MRYYHVAGDKEGEITPTIRDEPPAIGQPGLNQRQDPRSRLLGVMSSLPNHGYRQPMHSTINHALHYSTFAGNTLPRQSVHPVCRAYLAVIMKTTDESTEIFRPIASVALHATWYL